MSDATAVADLPDSVHSRIGLATLAGYLVGRRDAILKLAGNHSTLWVGFLLVLSAGFAREYDGEDLLAEPWHLLIPLAASLVSSLLLFGLVLLAARRHQMKEGSAGRLYLQFLGLYWMTAPLAWVYAVPVERFLSGPDSVRANLWLLGLVAVWRVVLIIRVITVLYGAKPVAAAMLVLAFGDVLVFVLMQTVDVPLLQIMGGVRLSESEQIIADVATSLIALSMLTAPIWLIGAAFVLSGGAHEWRLAVPPETMRVGVSAGLGVLVVVSLAIWSVLLPITQPEQQLRTRVDRLVEQNRLSEAIEVMEAAGPDAFPPHWTPPPRVTRRGIDISLVVELLTHIGQSDSSRWLDEIYWSKLEAAFQRHFNYSFRNYWSRASTSERLALVELLERQPRQRVHELFDGDRPVPISSVEDDGEERLNRELEDRLNALWEDEVELPDDDSTHAASAADP
jgi:hypothetical protein